MSIEEIVKYFYTNSANLSIRSILIVLAAGLLIGMVIFATYWVTYRGVAYNARFNVSLVVILEISIVIMLMISSNIVISLGMVGALSIVRFRTAIKDSRDTVFIFWAIAEGLSVGSQNFKLAMVTTVFVALILLAFHFFPKLDQKYLLIVRAGGANIVDITRLMDVLKTKANGVKLRAANRDNGHQEMIFELRAKQEMGYDQLQELYQIDGVESVYYVVESSGTVG